MALFPYAVSVSMKIQIVWGKLAHCVNTNNSEEMTLWNPFQ